MELENLSLWQRFNSFLCTLVLKHKHNKFSKIYVTCLQLRLVKGSIKYILSIQRATPNSGIMVFKQLNPAKIATFGSSMLYCGVMIC